jgi:hypothetical protein
MSENELKYFQPTLTYIRHSMLLFLIVQNDQIKKSSI